MKKGPGCSSCLYSMLVDLRGFEITINKNISSKQQAQGYASFYIIPNHIMKTRNILFNSKSKSNNIYQNLCEPSEILRNKTWIKKYQRLSYSNILGPIYQS